MLNVIILSGVMLSVILLSVVAPFRLNGVLSRMALVKDVIKWNFIMPQLIKVTYTKVTKTLF